MRTVGREDCHGRGSLFHEDEIDGGNQAKEGCEMIPMETLSAKADDGEDGKDTERDDLLHNLELHEGVWASVSGESDPVGGYLEAVFKECKPPGNEYHDVERCVGLQYAGVLKFQMAIPCEDHEDIADDEQRYREYVMHKCPLLFSLPPSPFFRRWEKSTGRGSFLPEVKQFFKVTAAFLLVDVKWMERVKRNEKGLSLA